jgi:NDP-sugar pyrophosphorylase family protein
MLLAAGFGTRLKPFTDHHPKALAEITAKHYYNITSNIFSSLAFMK